MEGYQVYVDQKALQEEPHPQNGLDKVDDDVWLSKFICWRLVELEIKKEKNIL